MGGHLGWPNTHTYLHGLLHGSRVAHEGLGLLSHGRVGLRQLLDRLVHQRLTETEGEERTVPVSQPATHLLDPSP